MSAELVAAARAAAASVASRAGDALAEPWLCAAWHDPSYIPQAHHRLMSAEIRRWAASRDGRLMITLPPQTGKPVYNGTMILMGDGSRKPIADVQVGETVITHTGRARRVNAVHEQGELECLRITTAYGRETVAALDHPFLTPEGFVQARHLVPGQVLAAVPQPATEPTSTLTKHEARLLAYFIGDGNTTASGTSFAASITTASAGVDAEIRRCADLLGFTVRRGEYKKEGAKAWKLILSKGVRPWLSSYPGIARCNSHTKRVPQAVMQARPEVIAEFIGGYWDCDGVISFKGEGRDGKPRQEVSCELYSVSRDLLADVQHLLLRLGISSSLRLKNGTYKNAEHRSWRLSLIARDDVARFRDTIRLANERRVERLAGHPLPRTRFDQSLLPDPIVSIEPAGILPCRCLTVDEDHTFTADDLVVHNSLLSVVWAAFWLLARDPTERIIIASCTQDLANYHGAGIRDRIDAYGQVHGLVLKRGSNRSNFFMTTEGGYVRCVGVGGMTTGFPATRFLMDDLFKDWVEATSPTARDKKWLWASAVARTRLQPGGGIAHVGTRWNEDDVAGRFMTMQPGRWRILRLPAIADSEDDPLGRPLGAPLPRPGYNERDTEALTAEWASHRADQPVVVWEAMYQGDPHPPGGALITAEELQRIECLDPAARPVMRAVSVDPSVGGASASAGATGRQNTFGIVAGWLGDDNRVYLTDDATRVMTPEEGCERALECAADTGSGLVLIEGNQGGAAWVPLMTAAWERLVARGRVSGHCPRLQVHTARGDKATRAQLVAGMMHHDRVRFAAKLPGLWREWTAWRPGDESPGRIDASGHLVLKLLPEHSRSGNKAASPATSPLTVQGRPGPFPWR